MTTIFRIHPAIGIARVGNSNDYYFGPETRAGVVDEKNGLVGGLPISKDTGKPIMSTELRDKDQKLKGQAARFRIFMYDPKKAESYPRGDGKEIHIGYEFNSVEYVADIIWVVHLANKKANAYVLDENKGLHAYDNEATPNLRNFSEEQPPPPDTPNQKKRIQDLVIDPGPRVIHGREAKPVAFNQTTGAKYVKPLNDIFKVTDLPGYPKNFPDHSASGGKPSDDPTKGPITSLGELHTDKDGRLIVVAASGRATGWKDLKDDVNNDGWFDDVADGPVTAYLVIKNNVTFTTTQIIKVDGSAWVITSDPAFAPQIPNPVTLWDDVYDTWVRRLGLCEGLYKAGDTEAPEAFNSTYRPSFDDDVRPILHGVGYLRWVANLSDRGATVHADLASTTFDTRPANTFLRSLGFIRPPVPDGPPTLSPNEPDKVTQRIQMPMSLGDAGHAMLSLTPTQYFFLQQWIAGTIQKGSPKLGPGEELDRAALTNCLGGRFNPGIEMTFICRDTFMWAPRGSNGPFRVNAKSLDAGYERTEKGDPKTQDPVLTGGYVPQRAGGLEPGDISKFMAIPWHTDYNSCAMHSTTPSIYQDNRVYWSWPAQRPVAVYPASKVSQDGQLPAKPWYSVRDPNNQDTDPRNSGRFKDRAEFLQNWSDIGTVIQGLAIDKPKGLPANYFLEVESQMPVTDADQASLWPNEFKPSAADAKK